VKEVNQHEIVAIVIVLQSWPNNPCG